MPSRKRPDKKRPDSVEALFNKVLPGEAHPDEDQIRMMMRGAIAIAAIGPWNRMGDREVYAFDSESGQRWYCIVMGSGGELFGLQAYRGDAGFALYDDVRNDRLANSEAFVARQDLFTVEYVPRAEFSPLDRAMLALSPEVVPHGQLAPQVTVSRPMHMRWHPNAADAAEINDGIMASLLFFHWMAAHPDVDPWAKKDTIPLLTNWVTDLAIEQIPLPPRPPTAPPAPTRLDERQLNHLLSKLPGRKLGHPMEIDVWPLLAPIGAKRPYFPWASLACDAGSGFAFVPVMGGADEKPEDVLLRGAIGALEQSPFRPSALHVRDERGLQVLALFGQALEIPVKIAPLPALDEARAALLQHLSR